MQYVKENICFGSKKFWKMNISSRKISSLSINFAKLNNLKGKSKSSQQWLQRQLSDPYVEKAKLSNYRCRSAFKLIEICDKYKILKTGDTVLDCGAAPGGWTQVVVNKINSDGAKQNAAQGKVIGIDLQRIHPIPGATLLDGVDFTAPTTHKMLNHLLDGRQPNCILSDMAPNSTGVKSLDQEIITDLCWSVLNFAKNFSAKGGHLLVKLWENGNIPKLEEDMRTYYQSVKRVKPMASRSDSAEIYLLARFFI